MTVSRARQALSGACYARHPRLRGTGRPYARLVTKFNKFHICGARRCGGGGGSRSGTHAETLLTESAPARGCESVAPAVPRLEFGKSLAHVAGIPKLKEKLKDLEARLAALERGDA